MRSLVLLLLFAFLAALATPGQAGTDLAMLPGQKAEGEIVFSGEEDHVRLPLLAGETLTLKLKGKDGLRLDVRLLGPGGTEIPIAARLSVKKDGAKIKGKRIPAAATGDHTLILAGRDGTTGSYSLSVKSSTADSVKVKGVPVPPESTYAFAARAGTRLTFSVKRSSGDLWPEVTLRGPGGGTISLPGLIDAFSKVSAKKHTLLATGDYTLVVGAGAGTSGEMKVKISLDPPSTEKVTLDFRGSSGGGDGGQPIALHLFAPETAAAPGATLGVVAAADFEDGHLRDVTSEVRLFSSHPVVVAPGTAPATVDARAAGAAVIRATYRTAASGGVVITVGDVTLSSLEVLPAAPAVGAGDTTRCFATGRFSDGSRLDLTDAVAWAVSQPARAEIHADGRVDGLSAGSATVTATLDGVASPGVTLSVAAPRLVSISLSPSFAALSPNGSRSLTATGRYADGTTRNVTSAATWRSDIERVATVSASGTVTARAAGAAGVRATLEGLSSPPAIVRVGAVTTTGITAVSTSHVYGLGDSVVLGTTATFSNGMRLDATGAATLVVGSPVLLDVDGSRVTALSPGSTTITASVDGRSVVIPVTVGAARLAGVAVIPPTSGLETGSTAQLTAVATYGDGSLGDVTSSAIWSSPAAALTSSGQGRVQSNGAGVAPVSARVGSTTGAPALVAVNGATLESLEAVRTSAAPRLGETVDVAVTARDSTQATLDVTAGATLAGDLDRLFVTGPGRLGTRAVGDADVRARLAGVTSDTLEVAVGAPTRIALEVQPASPTLPFGSTFPLAAQASRTDGAVEDRTDGSSWTSSNENVATLSGGTLTTVGWGTTSIRATDGTLTSPLRSVTVTAPPSPVVSAVTPDTLDSGVSSVTLTLTGANFRDDLSIAVAFSGSGVTVKSVTFVSTTSLTVVVDVAASAALTDRDVTVTLTGASGSVAGTGTNLLSIGGAPTVTGVSPSSAPRGAKGLELTISGARYISGATVTISGSGITMSSTTWVNPTTMRVKVDVEYDAPASARDVTVKNPAAAGGESGTGVGAFQIRAPDPIAVRASPDSGLRGASALAVTVWGGNFESGSAVSFSGSGITVHSTTFTDGGKLVASISISGSAALGGRDVTVTLPAALGGGSVTARGLFAVLSDTPVVSGLSPGRIVAGASAVPVTISGSGFAAGATVTVSGTGVTVSGVSVVDASTIAAALTIGSGATTGTRNVTVKNAASAGGKSGTGTALLTILSSSSVAVYAVTPSEGPGSGGTRVVVTGANFPVRPTVLFGANAAGAVIRLDASTIVATVPRASSLSKTASTAVDVKVQSGASSGTLAGGWRYRADAVGPWVTGTAPPNRLLNTSTPDVPGNTVRVTFRVSEPLGASSVSRSNFVLARRRVTDASFFTQTGGTVALSADGRHVTFTVPSSLNQTGARFYISMTTSVTDVAGNALDPTPWSTGQYQTQWKLASSSDTTAPTISSVSPSHLATGVAADTAVTVAFSEIVDPVVAMTAFSLKQGSTPVAGRASVSDDGKVLTFVPDGILEASKTYTVGVSTAVRDTADNALASAHSSTFTVASSDGAKPVIDVLTVDDIPADMNGTTTYKDSSGTDRNFRLLLPPDGFLLRIAYSDVGGSGIDPTSLVVRCSKDLGTGSGKIAANTDFSSSFTVTPLGASWQVPSSKAVAVDSGATFTVSVKDQNGNLSSSATLTVEIASRTAALDPFDTRQVWLLRFDHDAYRITASADGFIGGGSTKADTKLKVTSVRGASVPPKADFVEDLEILGLLADESGQGASTVTYGSTTGANAILLRRLQERIRARVRERYHIDADGFRDVDSVSIEFLLAGERGSLSSPPDPAEWSSSGDFSQFGIGGEYLPNAGSDAAPLGTATYDDRNRSQESDVPVGNLSGDLGMFLTHLLRFYGNSEAFRLVFDAFMPLRNTGKTAVGQSDLDAVVLSGDFDRSASSNTAAQNARYDAIFTAVDVLALVVSSTVAHEIGHSTGLVSDGAPPKGLFGNADTRNTFAGSDTDSHHLDTPGPNLMEAASSFVAATRTGEDAERFGEMINAYLRRRLLYDETR